MKKRFLLSLLVLAAAASHAADTRQFKTQGEVPAKCKFVSGTLGISFGALDPSVGGEVSRSIPLSYECTWGTAPASIQVGANAAGSYAGAMKLAGSGGGANKEIAYALTWSNSYPAGLGFGGGSTGNNGTQVAIDINATVAAGAYSRVAAGAYEDTVSFTINP